MKYLSHLIQTAFFCFIVATSCMAQQSGSEEDPFKNDPLFTKPFKDFFKNGNDSCSNSKSTGDYERLLYLNEEGLDFEGLLEAGPYNSGPLYGIYPSLPMIHFNRVDALFLGLRQERMQWYRDAEFLGIPNIHPHGMIGYSFGLNDFQYIAGLERFIGRKNHVILGAEYHNSTSTDDYWRVGLNETTLTAFSGGYDYLDYYKQQGWGAYLLFRTNRLLEGGIAYSDDEYSSVQQQTDFALFGSSGRYRLNPPVAFADGEPLEAIDISSFTVSGSFNPKRLLLSRHFTTSVTGSVEFADPGISTSDYSYTKYVTEIISFVNFERGGVIKHRFRAGSITGDAPAVKEFQLGGLGSLRALPYKSLPVNSFGDNQMLLNNFEVHFGAPKFDTDGWIDTDEFYISLFLDSGWTQSSSKLEETNDPFEGFSAFKIADLEHNGGFGLGSNLIRGELAWDLRNTSRAPVFWIRFNPTF